MVIDVSDGSAQILTNEHIVRDMGAEIPLYLPDGRGNLWPRSAKLQATRRIWDLALLEVECGSLCPPHLEIPEEFQARAGDDLFVMGFPYTALYDRYAVSRGILSSHGEGSLDNLVSADAYKLHIDAAIAPGNSGGPVLSMSGDLLGVVYGVHGRFDTSGYAIATPTIREFLDLQQRRGEPLSGEGGAS